MNTRIQSAFAAFSLAALCMAGTARAAAYLSPSQVEAGKGFTVTVSGKSDLCMPIWSQTRATEKDGLLTLEAAGVNNPAALCLAGVENDFNVDIPVPALKAGVYKVLFQRRLPCEFQPRACEPFIAPNSAGTLEVTDRAKLNYAFQPRTAAANRSFDLFLTNKNFTCGNTYSDMSVSVQGWQVYLTYTNRPNPAALCPAVIADYGPTFKVPAMAKGTYQVMAAAMPYCGKGTPCPLIEIAPQLAGALEIGAPSDRKAWTEPGLTLAGAVFRLELHGPFTCNDDILNKQVEVKDGKILLRYDMGRNKRMCLDTVFVHHETFTVPALAAGSYPVSLAPGDCPFTDSFLCAGTAAERAIDTVTASSALGVRSKSGMPGARVSGKRNQVKVLWRGAPADLAGRRGD
jgi:hypothetical protein